MTTTGSPPLETELLSALLDRQLSSDEQELAERHLAACLDCADELAGLRATVELLRMLPQVEAPRSFRLPLTTARPAAAGSPLLRLVPWTRALGTLAAALFV